MVGKYLNLIELIVKSVDRTCQVLETWQVSVTETLICGYSGYVQIFLSICFCLHASSHYLLASQTSADYYSDHPYCWRVLLSSTKSPSYD